MDGRGGGRSDHPLDPGAHGSEEHVADTLAVMDATRTERATLVAMSVGAQRAMLLAEQQPDRVEGVIFIEALFPVGLVSRLRMRMLAPIAEVLEP